MAGIRKLEGTNYMELVHVTEKGREVNAVSGKKQRADKSAVIALLEEVEDLQGLLSKEDNTPLAYIQGMLKDVYENKDAASIVQGGRRATVYAELSTVLRDDYDEEYDAIIHVRARISEAGINAYAFVVGENDYDTDSRKPYYLCGDKPDGYSNPDDYDYIIRRIAWNAKKIKGQLIRNIEAYCRQESRIAVIEGLEERAEARRRHIEDFSRDDCLKVLEKLSDAFTLPNGGGISETISVVDADVIRKKDDDNVALYVNVTAGTSAGTFSATKSRLAFTSGNDATLPADGVFSDAQKYAWSYLLDEEVQDAVINAFYARVAERARTAAETLKMKLDADSPFMVEYFGL